MKILSIAMAALLVYVGCTLENEESGVVSVLVRNGSGESLTESKVCVETTSTCRVMQLLADKDSINLKLDLPAADGGFIYTGKLGSKDISKRFGYFTNGHSNTDHYRIRILSKDSITVE